LAAGGGIEGIVRGHLLKEFASFGPLLLGGADQA
jgi:hypothetical protein